MSPTTALLPVFAFLLVGGALAVVTLRHQVPPALRMAGERS